MFCVDNWLQIVDRTGYQPLLCRTEMRAKQIPAVCSILGNKHNGFSNIGCWMSEDVKAFLCCVLTAFSCPSQDATDRQCVILWARKNTLRVSPVTLQNRLVGTFLVVGDDDTGVVGPVCWEMPSVPDQDQSL